ncbi:MAG: phage baseplate assembly protein V [Oscillospiraceae bacterium]|jgi:uncharacterized protein involved in type VI secretion and phage assembly|nr:phage baseplate assembly protein V [Oscillospiraceae bacterium]
MVTGFFDSQNFESPLLPIKLGVVKSLDDPDKKNRILISFYDDDSEYWAHLISHSASNNTGFVNYPDVGNTAIVAFVDGLTFFPVILGFVFGDKNKTPLDLKKENNEEVLVTRGGLKRTIINEKDKQTITYKTKKEHQIVIDDEKEIYKISSKDGKTSFNINFKQGEIMISAKKIILKGEHDEFTFEDGKGFELKSSSGKFTAETSDVSLKAKNKFTAKGTAGTEIQSDAKLVLKGSMTQIN